METTSDLGTAGSERLVTIPSGSRRLEGILSIPPHTKAVVAFAHGSGSGRHSPRNQYVARVLQENGIATLLLDLLEPEEADDRRKVFDIELLAGRLESAAQWLTHEPETRRMPLGYFGASTGAAATLVAASRRPEWVDAVVSRGGRPDLAGAALSRVTVPTLLIVGGLDTDVLTLNRQALALLRCVKDLVVVPGATHLFQEPGTLEEVADLAARWFLQHLGKDPANRQTDASTPPIDVLS